MASVPEVTALDALPAAERSVVLTQLLLARPELRAEAETIAATVLSAGDIGQIGEDVAAELRNLPISDLAGRAGPPGDGGYMQPHEAANEMLAEIVQPYLDDIARRPGLGASVRKRDIGLGVLLGLYSCREDDGNDKVLPMLRCPTRSTTCPHRVRGLAQGKGPPAGSIG